MPFEDDLEDKDKEPDVIANASADSNKASKLPIKRQRLNKIELNAAAFIEDLNIS